MNAHASAFDDLVVKFHMAFVDKKCTEALRALVELRKSLYSWPQELQENALTHFSVCEEVKNKKISRDERR